VKCQSAIVPVYLITGIGTSDSTMNRGQFHIYTGNGKGKTTAAIGLAIRAAGAGKRVLFTQFVKGMEYHEIKVLKKLGGQLTFRNYGRNCFINREPAPEDFDAVRAGIADLLERFTDLPPYDLIIVDEINIALHFNLMKVEDALMLVDKRPTFSEIVLTGRYAPPELIERADLVTEMQEIRHYFQLQNLPAREGIEF
jgi:cob(I)alamin adenosyltransferase